MQTRKDPGKNPKGGLLAVSKWKGEGRRALGWALIRWTSEFRVGLYQLGVRIPIPGWEVSR